MIYHDGKGGIRVHVEKGPYAPLMAWRIVTDLITAIIEAEQHRADKIHRGSADPWQSGHERGDYSACNRNCDHVL